MSHEATVRYNVFGTSAAKKTLTAAFVADTANAAVVFTEGFREFTLNIAFTTGSATGEFVDVQIETSADGTNFFVWGEDHFPDASPPTFNEVSGTFYRFPADVATPAAATTYLRSYTFKTASNYLRFKVKSSAAANFGSAWVELWAAEY